MRWKKSMKPQAHSGALAIALISAWFFVTFCYSHCVYCFYLCSRAPFGRFKQKVKKIYKHFIVGSIKKVKKEKTPPFPKKQLKIPSFSENPQKQKSLTIENQIVKLLSCSEDRDRTCDLRVMSPTSYRCSTSRCECKGKTFLWGSQIKNETIEIYFFICCLFCH